MATATYTFVRRCTGGDHVTMDVQLGGGAIESITFDIDEVRKALSLMPQEEVMAAKLLLFRIHVSGKTRAQLVTEFASPVTITI